MKELRDDPGNAVKLQLYALFKQVVFFGLSFYSCYAAIDTQTLIGTQI